MLCAVFLSGLICLCIPFKTNRVGNVVFRFRPHMLWTLTADLFAHMRKTSSLLSDKTDKELMEGLKKYLIEESETASAGGDGGCAAGGRSSGTTSFSPKKPRGPDNRPAILARRTWLITVDRKRKIVTVSGKQHLFEYFL